MMTPKREDKCCPKAIKIELVPIMIDRNYTVVKTAESVEVNSSRVHASNPTFPTHPQNQLFSGNSKGFARVTV